MTTTYVQLASGTILETNDPAIWLEATRISAAKGKAALKAEALEQLRKMLKPGDTIHTVLRHVSRSGMFRRIDLFLLRKGVNDTPIFLTGYAARVLDYKLSRDGGIGVGGCGMDMGFHLVHHLGYAVFGYLGTKTGARANKLRQRLLDANRHYFTQGGRTAPDPSKPGDEWTHGAGYAFKHRWL